MLLWAVLDSWLLSCLCLAQTHLSLGLFNSNKSFHAPKLNLNEKGTSVAEQEMNSVPEMLEVHKEWGSERRFMNSHPQNVSVTPGADVSLSPLEYSWWSPRLSAVSKTNLAVHEDKNRVPYVKVKDSFDAQLFIPSPQTRFSRFHLHPVWFNDNNSPPLWSLERSAPVGSWV